MRLKNLKQTLAFVARAIGDKMGVLVTIGGHQAYTDGKRINIPALPENSDEAAIMARGFIDHEAGHVRNTDLDVLQGVTPAEKTLWNIIEDPRIEDLMGSTYPGCKINLEKVAELVAKRGGFSLPEEGDIPPARVFNTWLLAKLRYEVLGQAALKPALEDARETMEIVFGQDLMPHLELLGDSAKRVSSSADSMEVARNILQTLKDWASNPPPPPSQQPEPEETDDSEDSSDESQSGDQGNGDGGDASGDTGASGSDSDPDGSEQSSAADGSGSGQGDDDEDDRSSGSAKADSKQGKGKKSPSEEEAESDDSQGQGAGKGKAQKDLADAISQIIGASEDDLKGLDIGELIADALSEKSEHRDSPYQVTIPEEEDACSGQVDVGEVRQTTAQLRARLAGLVQASRHKNSSPRKTGRRVDRKALSRIARGDGRIFTSREEKTDVNTAVMILLDRSGSMGGPRIQVARQAVLASALALEAIPGVSVASAAFPANCAWDGVVNLTKFGQSPRRTSGNYAIGATGGTPLTEALYWAGYQLSARREPRKILIVATDGDPNDGQSTLIAVERLRNSGIEVLALGIMFGGVARYFPEYEVIQSLPELPQALFGMLNKKLAGAA